MKRLILLLLPLVFAIHSAFTQDIETVKYFPIKVGNTWIYTCTGNNTAFCTCLTKTKVKITQVIQKYNRFYFIFYSQSNQIVYCPLGCGSPAVVIDTLRIDTNSCNIYKFVENNGCPYSPHEILYDSLKIRLNDTINSPCSNILYNRCTDTSNIMLFGMQRKSKKIGWYAVDSHYDRKYVKGIGPFEYTTSANLCVATKTLNGCIIDGILYGDTTFPVGVNNISVELPEKYFLFQNYPNPFNPSTSIKFSMPIYTAVKILIYNVLGEEISTLVNNEYPPGTYEVVWNSDDNPSGLYYYKIECNEYSDVKKMVLIK
jgi:hypothetical protein